METETHPQSVTDLPPETLAFASKCFDLARQGDIATMTIYLERGLPPNMTNEKGNTLLMLAAYSGHSELVKILASKGADINRLNDRGQSPLAGAIFKNEDEVVKTLLDLGADIRSGSPNAIDTAKMFGQKRWLKQMGVTEEESRAPTPPMMKGPDR